MKVHEVAPIFAESMRTVLSTMALIEPEIGAASEKHDNVCWGTITGLISMRSPKLTGSLILSFDDASIVEIVQGMLQERFDSHSQEVTDAVGEMTNMVCGLGKQKLSEQGIAFDMATPMVIRGVGTTLAQIHAGVTLQIPFKTKTGTFVIETNMKDL